MLRFVADDLWVAEQPQRFFGLEIGTRMTVVRLPSSDLWLHSPIRRTPELERELAALGRVRFAVAPNRFHHLYVADWTALNDAVELFVAPGISDKRPDLREHPVLSSTAPPAWADVIEQVAFEGFPLLNEVAFFHRPSRTLVLSDLAARIGPESPAWTRFMFRLSGTYDRLAPLALERFSIRDRTAARASLRRILDWPFERVVVAHGSITERAGREEFERGWRWLLQS